jgi:hypothetical protein
VVDAYNRRDVDCGFAELVTPDFEWWPALTRAYGGDCYGRGSGAPVDQPYAGILDFPGDSACRYRVYFDHAEGRRAAGLAK